jgi:hypothetical protein
MSLRLSDPNIQHILEDIKMESEDSVVGGPYQTEAHVLMQEKETRPWALSPIATARSRAPSPHAEAGSRASSLIAKARDADLEDKASSTYTSVKPSDMDWTVGKPLSKLGGKLKMNLFQALVDIIPHETLTGDWDYSSRGIAETMLYYQLVVSFSFGLQTLFPLLIGSNILSLLYQSVVKSMVLYCHLRKFFDDSNSKTEALRLDLLHPKPRTPS